MIRGDFNAFEVEWCSVKTNIRGSALLEAFSTLEIGIANIETTLIYEEGGMSSIIDLTFIEPVLVGERLG